MRGKWNFHRILITIEKSFVKWIQITETRNIKDHSGYELSQWAKTIWCIIVSHWLCPYPEWSLNMHPVRALLDSVVSFLPETNGFDFKYITFEHILVMNILDYFLWICDQVVNDKPTSVQTIAWCSQATSHYQGQYWPRAVSPYGVIKTQYVKVSLAKANFAYCLLQVSSLASHNDMHFTLHRSMEDSYTGGFPSQRPVTLFSLKKRIHLKMSCEKCGHLFSASLC